MGFVGPNLLVSSLSTAGIYSTVRTTKCCFWPQVCGENWCGNRKRINLHWCSDRKRIKLLMVGDAGRDYYGESSGSSMVREFTLYEELEEIVKLASQSIPERPDGIVVVVKYSSANREECRSTEAEYERFARENPATVFLR